MRLTTAARSMGQKPAGCEDTQASPVQFVVRSLQSGDDAVYQGSMMNGHTKAGEFVARVDRRKQAMLIEELFVDQGYRGNGIGKKALTFLETEAARLKLRKVIVDPCPIDLCAFDEETLRQWYLKNGYTSNARGFFRPQTNLLAKAL